MFLRYIVKILAFDISSFTVASIVDIILLSSIISIVPTLSPFFTGAIILFILVLYVMFFWSSLFLFNMVMFSFGTISVVRVFPSSTFFFSIVVF